MNIQPRRENMHAWEGRPFDDIAVLTQKRDPRRYPLGCVTEDDDRACVQWFRSVPELVQFLLRMEPQRWGIRQAALIEHKARLQPTLTEVDVMGLSDAARRTINEVTRPAYRIRWWGSFEVFRRTPEVWPSALAAGLPPAADEDRIVEQLRTLARARHSRRR